MVSKVNENYLCNVMHNTHLNKIIKKKNMVKRAYLRTDLKCVSDEN